jgi:hypothetical protein
MNKTLNLIKKQYTLLEAAPFPEAEAAAPIDPTQADPTVAANPQPQGAPETQKLTSQAEVNMIKKLVQLIQTVTAVPPDQSTSTEISNFDVDSINTSNARDMLKTFEGMLQTNTLDKETTNIDNKYGPNL